jgi:hypothetical protein
LIGLPVQKESEFAFPAYANSVSGCACNSIPADEDTDLPLKSKADAALNSGFSRLECHERSDYPESIFGRIEMHRVIRNPRSAGSYNVTQVALIIGKRAKCIGFPPGRNRLKRVKAFSRFLE